MPYWGGPWGRRYSSFYRRPYQRRTTRMYIRRPQGRRLQPRTTPLTSLASSGVIARAQNVHYHNRHAHITAIDMTEMNNTTIGQNFLGGLGARAFQLQDCPDYNEFADLYDEYRFRYVELTFTMTNAPVPADLVEESIIGQWTLWIDTDAFDTIMPSAETFLQRGTVRQFEFRADKGNKVKVRLRPKAQRQLYNGVLSSAYTSAGQPFIHTIYPGVPHYGVKFMIRAPFNSTAAVPTIDAPPLVNIEAEYYFAFKKTK